MSISMFNDILYYNEQIIFDEFQLTIITYVTFPMYTSPNELQNYASRGNSAREYHKYRNFRKISALIYYTNTRRFIILKWRDI